MKRRKVRDFLAKLEGNFKNLYASPKAIKTVYIASFIAE